MRSVSRAEEWQPCGNVLAKVLAAWSRHCLPADALGVGTAAAADLSLTGGVQEAQGR
jgi:hypothetical protein